MRGDELAVEQLPAAGLEPRHQMRQRDFRRISRAADHRFAEKGTTERNAVQAADQIVPRPAFDAVRMAELEQSLIARLDDGVDPRRRPIVGGLGAQRHHRAERGVGRDAKPVGDDDFPEALRQMEAAERQDRTQSRFDPMDRRVIRPVGHREQPLRIGAEQQRGVYGFDVPQRAGFTNFSVMRSDSPIARYFSRSLSPSRRFGGNVQTPFG